MLTMPVSKPAGLVWLTACLLLITTGTLSITGSKYWWLAGIFVWNLEMKMRGVYMGSDKDARLSRSAPLRTREDNHKPVIRPQ